ncbi:unnamed protein product [Adineta ricciae]|uniref:Reverse transcriptase domain-containing protein n=1 Tax=Adineta ricciae TaxID=249248 RepID=A0A815WQF2_ADIRI|nr:unnamed protein product [Adineta ricciae]
MIDEWNKRGCISNLCKQWKKNRPVNDKTNNLFVLLFNVEGLNTHLADVDLLLKQYNPHICILTGVGAATRKLPTFLGYVGISQTGTNSFGGVAILYQKHVKCKTIDSATNFLLIEAQLPTETVNIGAVYVPPGSLPLFQLFNKHAEQSFVLFGDFNAKHSTWNCKVNNTSGVHMANWLEDTGNEMIIPNSATSRRSDAVIDFAVSNNATGWKTEVLHEGTSDHWPTTMATATSRACPKHKQGTKKISKNKEKRTSRAVSSSETHFHRRKKQIHPTKARRENNIWKHVSPTFRPFAPPFKGIQTEYDKKTDPKQIVNMLADHYEKHFANPQHDTSNKLHQEAIDIFENFKYLPKIPLEQITYQEVEREWKKFQPKKSTDSTGTSALILKKLPTEYLAIITILFNKCAKNGDFFDKGKIAKVICLSKDGLFPTVNKLRPISLLPNLAKWFERIIHARILKWCNELNIAVDEQSGFMQGRRLQTRTLSLIENLRLTTAACNRPALVIFVDFASAFDRMWHPALIRNLNELGMPLPLLKWVHSWLTNRWLYLSYGDENSRTIQMLVGAPQGSVLAATLFRLHIHFLPAIFNGTSIHMFADDLALVLDGAIEKRLSDNIIYLEKQARTSMMKLEQYSHELILPVNVAKTKALLVHSAVAPSLPKVRYQDQQIEHVNSFKYLGVHISTKLGWGNYINERLRKIRNIYKGLRQIYQTISTEHIDVRRKIFLAYALPHLCWLFSTWFYFTERQQRSIEHVYCTGIRLTYSIYGWDDITTLILSQEKSLRDYLYSYWTRLCSHLEKASEAVNFQQSWKAFQILTGHDTDWRRNIDLGKNNWFLTRLIERVQHSLMDWKAFQNEHKQQLMAYKNDTQYLNMFIYKYYIQPTA